MKKIIISDIDGTLANNDQRECYLRENPINLNEYYKACADDSPIQQNINLLKFLINNYDFGIILLTERPLNFIEPTKTWLLNHFTEYIGLGMLAYKESFYTHKSSEAKKHYLLNKVCQDNKISFDQIVFAIDSNPKVVEMYNEFGLNAFQSKVLEDA